MKLWWTETVGLTGVRDFLVLIAMIALIGALTFFLENRTATGAYRTEYEGRIVDEAIQLHESEEGSWMEQYLIIEERPGVRTQVAVRPRVYDQAKIGMWIKRDKKGVELSSPQDSTAPF